jgi:Sulfotransferase family.
MIENQNIIPALFLHIQKTAGSALLEMVCRHYRNNLTRHGDCWGHAPNEFREIPFVSGHFGYAYAKCLMPGRYTFTFLREPVERIISMYYFCRGRNPDQFSIYRRAHELDFKDFLEAGLTDPLVKMHIWNNQVWQLAYGYYGPRDDKKVDDFSAARLLELAKEHLEEFSHVGLTETTERDGAKILSALNISSVSGIPRVNITERPHAADISTSALALLDELTFLDKQLYDYALQRRIRNESKNSA